MLLCFLLDLQIFSLSPDREGSSWIFLGSGGGLRRGAALVVRPWALG